MIIYKTQKLLFHSVNCIIFAAIYRKFERYYALMKRFTWIFILAAIAAIVIFYQSCKKDPCKDVICEFTGYCVDGKCVCPQWLFGTDCDSTYPELLAGNYNALDSCIADSPRIYAVTITRPDTSRQLFYINNIYQYNEQITAILKTQSPMTFIIPRQTFIYKGVSITVDSGSGYDVHSVFHDTIHLHYSLNSPALDSCHALLMR